MIRTAEDVLRSLAKYLAEAVLIDWEVRLAIEEGTFRRPFCRVGLAGPQAFTGPAVHTDVLAPFAAHLFPVEQSAPEEALLVALRVQELLYQGFRVGGGTLGAPGQPLATATAGSLAAGSYRYVVTATRRGGGESVASSPVSLTLADVGGVALTWPALGGADGYRIYRGPAGAERLLAAVGAALAFTDDGTRTAHSTAAPPSAGTATVGAPMRVPLYDSAGMPLSSPASVRGPNDFARVNDLSVGLAVDPEDERKVVVTADIRLAWRRRGRVPTATQTLAAVRAAGTV
jgi:hypothetical protein